MKKICSEVKFQLVYGGLVANNFITLSWSQLETADISWDFDFVDRIVGADLFMPNEVKQKIHLFSSFETV